jgi:phosphatidylglycerophosphatase A
MTLNIDAHAAPAAPRKRPRFAFAIATVLGVGNAPKAPGTFGSLAGIVLAIVTNPVSLFALMGGYAMGQGGFGVDAPIFRGHPAPFLLLVPSLIAIAVVAALGVWSGSQVARYAGTKDPRYVVIDEVSGMQLTLVLAIMPLGAPTQLLPSDNALFFALYSALSLLNWKYLLAGFVLFRLFDIVKPFPCRQLEKLPDGWGIMADDWMAGIYAAILLRLALHFGLL